MPPSGTEPVEGHPSDPRPPAEELAEAAPPEAGAAPLDTAAEAAPLEPLEDEALDDEALDEEVESRSLHAFDRVREVLAGPATLSLAEVAEQCRLPVQILREIFDATGWSNRPGYDERDLEYARAAARLLDVFPMQVVIRSLRTRYRAISSIVVGDLGTVRDHVVAPAVLAGADPDGLAEAIGAATAELLPLITGQLAEDYRHVILQLIDSEAVARGLQVGTGREIELSVGFVDIVDYTVMSGQADPAALEHVLSGFEDLVTAAVAQTDEVLLAKFVGDAAMLVASNPEPLVSLLLDLVDDRKRLAEAPRRAGMACGPVLVREGDYYGAIPNLASRLTDHAEAWTLLAAEELEERLEGRFSVERISKTTIRGIGSRRPLRVRRR
jgi:adenylate cyclase